MTVAHNLNNQVRKLLSRRDVWIERKSRQPFELRNRLFAKMQINHLVDVGAHKGEFVDAILSSGWQGKVDSLEPDPRSFKVLARMAKQIPNWHVHQIAASFERGAVDFHLSENGVSSSVREVMATHVGVAPNSRKSGVVVVQAERLDDLFSIEPSDRIFLKIDVQGLEAEVLAGAEQLLENVVLAQIELSFTPLYKDQTLWMEIARTMSERGFRMCGVIPGFTDPATGIMLQVDALFGKESELESLRSA